MPEPSPDPGSRAPHRSRCHARLLPWVVRLYDLATGVNRFRPARHAIADVKRIESQGSIQWPPHLKGRLECKRVANRHREHARERSWVDANHACSGVGTRRLDSHGPGTPQHPADHGRRPGLGAMSATTERKSEHRISTVSRQRASGSNVTTPTHPAHRPEPRSTAASARVNLGTIAPIAPWEDFGLPPDERVLPPIPEGSGIHHLAGRQMASGPQLP